MRKFGYLIVLCAMLASAAEDKRIINGIAVDLTPLRDWLASPQGERPLKHWKQIHVLSLETAGGMDRCKVKSEGVPREICVVNVPSNVRQAVQLIATQEVAISALRAQVAARHKAIDHPPPKVHVSASARQELRDMETSLQKLESEHKTLLAHSDHNCSILAMFTGRTIRETESVKLEVWDCGKALR